MSDSELNFTVDSVGRECTGAPQTKHKNQKFSEK